MWDIIGVLLATISGIIVCVLCLFYMRKHQKKEPISLFKYYGILIGMILLSMLFSVVIWDGLTVISKMLKGESDLIKGTCDVHYWEEYSEESTSINLDIIFSEDVSFRVSPKDWDQGDLKNAYCEVTHYDYSEFGIHYKIYDQENGTLLQQD
jgi:hypothetical protein